MSAEKVAFMDFETEAIKPRPEYPPKPVGLAVHGKGLETEYHRCRTPSERLACAKRIRSVYRAGYLGCWHNGSFDLDVAETHLGVAWPAYHHDTLLLAYLFDPRAPTFSLKPMAERVLGIVPAARDRLKEWVLANVAEATEKNWGAYISRAPYELVRPYAISDTKMTGTFFWHFQRMLAKDADMRRAYARELKVTRVLVKMERRGVPIDATDLERDLGAWKAQKADIERMLYRDLKVPKKSQEEFKWAGKNFGNQIVRAGLVDSLPKTLKGNDSVAADTLGPLLPPKIAERIELRSQLATCITTFGEAWLAQARVGGRFYARYNQVRQDYHGGGKMIGTTTGRLSMTPNLQNVIRSDKGDKVPRLRRYLVPPRGQWWLKRDFQQQEMRLFAHYEEGELLERYRAKPDIDVHTVCAEIIRDRAGLQLARRPVKDINFGVLYGMGRAKMALKLKMPLDVAIKVLAAYHRSLPGVRKLQRLLAGLARRDEPLYTWGGRKYYCEEPKVVETVVDGVVRRREMSFEYRMLNLLIQGGAADMTKEAMVRYDETGWNEEDKAPLVLQVHDELNSLVAAKHRKAAMRALDECMLSIECDVPMRSDGSASPVSWDACEEVSW